MTVPAANKILIVDDEPHLRLLLQQALEELEDENVELKVACDGEEALFEIKQDPPNLVFLDVMMPKRNGFEVCDIVKNVWNFENIYIVMLTAKGQEFDKQKGLQAGANVYMTKPFDPDIVIAKAREVLGL